MSEKELQNTLSQLQSISNHNLQNASSLLSRAKIQLLQLNALVPTPQTSPAHLALARDVLETGALLSIRQKDPEAFTRYFLQLQPFYSLDSSRWSGAPSAGRTIRSGTSSSDASRGNQSKVTGLYLLLLLSQGDYAGFHTVIEGLESQYGHKSKLDEDKFILYPLRLEQALMEGSYDRVWGETKGERVPSEEFGVFSEVRLRISSLATQANSLTVSGSHQHNPLGDRLVQRTRLPIPPNRQR